MPSTLFPDSSRYDLACQLQACKSNRPRNGKVARLPHELRQQINHMLDDGLLYKVIIEKLGEAGNHLNEDNLSNWRLGGYQDYLNASVIADRARAQTEAAADVLRDSGDLNPLRLQQVSPRIAQLRPNPRRSWRQPRQQIPREESGQVHNPRQRLQQRSQQPARP